MSWNDYITSKLLNVQDSNGHILVNAVEEAAIIGNTDGAIWASTQGFTIGTVTVEVEGKGKIQMNEFINIADAFAHNGDCTKDGGIRLNGVKYFMINFDNDKKTMYLKRQGGGAVIALTNMSYVIGTFNTEKMMTKDNVQENQNNGYCAKVVEELAALLISMNY